MKYKKGNSLIEALVVVVGIGVLASAGIAQYKNYIYRIKMSEAVRVLRGVLEKAHQEYTQTGVIPKTVAGYEANKLTTARTASLTLDFVFYHGSADGSNRTVVEGYLSPDLGASIPGYSESKGTTKCTACKIAVGFVVDNNMFKSYCGSFDNDPSYVPNTNLIPGCEYKDFGQTW